MFTRIEPTPEQVFAARIVIDMIDRLPRPAHGPAAIHVEAGQEIRAFTQTLLNRHWLAEGYELQRLTDVHRVRWADLQVEEPWLPEQKHLQACKRLLGVALTPGHLHRRPSVVGHYLLLTWHYARVYVATVDLMDGFHGIGFTEPNMWCGRCQSRTVDRPNETCTRCGWPWASR
jgi:hypothetical protein